MNEANHITITVQHVYKQKLQILRTENTATCFGHCL